MKKYINYDFLKNNKIIFDHRGQLVTVKCSLFLTKSINYKKRKEFVEKIKQFIITMSDNCPNFDIDLFQKNFSKMKFKFYSRKNKSTGIVIFLKKKCKIYDMESLFHELIHISTIRVSGSVEYCGFSVNDYYYGDSFAKGLNEGYTQLTKERYFGKDEAIVYPFEVKYASIVESLIGKEKMEELFFKTNLKVLFEEMKIYTEPSDFRMFLNDLDYINSNFPPKDQNDITIQERFDRINWFLFECLKRKLELEPDNKEIEEKMKILFDKPITCRYENRGKEIVVNNLDSAILNTYLENKKR